MGKKSLRRKKMCLVRKILSLKPCETSNIKCPERWVGKENLAQGEFR